MDKKLKFALKPILNSIEFYIGEKDEKNNWIHPRFNPESRKNYLTKLKG